MQDFVDLLREATQEAVFNVPQLGRPDSGFQCSAVQLREMNTSTSWYARAQLAGAKAQLSGDSFDRLVATLRSLLAGFTVDDKIGNGLALIIGGRPVLPLTEYALYLVRGAGLLGPDRMAHLLLGWVEGEPVPYSSCLVLSGLSIDEPMSMGTGIRLNKLPSSSIDLEKELPSGIGHQVGIMNLAGATKATIECQDDPVLFRPDESPEIRTTTIGSRQAFHYAKFCEALSLAYDHTVGWFTSWRDFGDLDVLGLGPGSGYSVQLDIGYVAPGPPILREQLDLADRLFTRRRDNAIPPMDIPIQRWASSKRQTGSLADKFIDLRIVLESLFLRESGPELGYRLAMHGAWYLGATPEERQRHFRTLRDVYSVASTAVHTGTVEPNEKNRQLLADAQDLCRSGILKRLKDGKVPVWSALVLGAEVDTTTGEE